MEFGHDARVPAHDVKINPRYGAAETSPAAAEEYKGDDDDDEVIFLGSTAGANPRLSCEEVLPPAILEEPNTSEPEQEIQRTPPRYNLI
jgi:hypothetical protein